MPEVSSRAAAWSLALVGAASLIAVVAVSLDTGRPTTVAPAVLALAFLLAGSIGARARPDHGGVLLMSAVGTAHLLAFAVSAWVEAGGSRGWAGWLAGIASDLAYTAGFLALALLLATYPTGALTTASQRRLAWAGVVWVAGAGVAEAVSTRVELALTGTVPRPWAGPALEVHLVGATPVLVLAGAGILLARARRAEGHEAGPIGWAKLAGAVLALLMLAAPAAVTLLPTAAWSAFFIVTVSTLPFLLLGGLVRHRLLDVDVYVVRTLARGSLGLAIVSAYAVLVAVAAQHVVLAAVALTLLAAAFASRVLALLEQVADRWATGGRVGRRAVLRGILDTLASRSSHDLGTSTIREALDVTGVRVRAGDRVLAEDGEVATVAESMPLLASGTEVATLECGPRRGGWGRGERETLQALVPAVALAVRDAQLTEELGHRVAELSRSRARLVRAEDTARRRVERDLHDGAQQPLVALLAQLGVAAALTDPCAPAAEPLDRARGLAADALHDLRELVAGIYPPVLVDQGLVAAVETRADLAPLPVRVDADEAVRRARLGADVESAAYFVVSEALTNVIKHAGADHACVTLSLDGTVLRVSVSDSGTGLVTVDGAGLTGLRDRVQALGGTLDVVGRAGAGTTVTALLRTGEPR